MISDIELLKRMLVHNVRMPMSVITGYGELLRQGLLNEEERLEAIQDICDNITYMDEVMRVVLDDDVKSFPALERVDVVEIIGKSIHYVQEVTRKIPIKIVLKSAEEHMYVRAEASQMMKIFYHLFENATKYLESGDSIMIQAYYVQDDQVLVVVKDNGRGIEESEAAHIFEEGFRGRNSAGKPGSGYGLYDVKRIVEQYGGTVEVSSRKNAGFSVFLMFPVYREP